MLWWMPALSPGADAGGPELPPPLEHYTRVDGVGGSLTAAGSDTMLQLQTLMAEAFRRLYPQVTIQIEGKGSSTAAPALIEGTLQLGNMSRRMHSNETDAFEDRYGYSPVRFDVALDTVAVLVHKDNPLPRLTVRQVDAIFSKNRRCGALSDISVWGQLGLEGRWATAPISLYGRNAASGTYGYFKVHAMCRGDFKDTVKEQPGSASVVQGVERDLGGIGYSGIGYLTSGVRAVPIVPLDGTGPVEASSQNAANGRYPLTRFLHVYVNMPPDRSLDRLTTEYLRFIYSIEGQAVVRRAGFTPLDAATVATQLAGLRPS